MLAAGMVSLTAGTDPEIMKFETSSDVVSMRIIVRNARLRFNIYPVVLLCISELLTDPSRSGYA